MRSRRSRTARTCGAGQEGRAQEGKARRVLAKLGGGGRGMCVLGGGRALGKGR
jgi:hypothetical protein